MTFATRQRGSILLLMIFGIVGISLLAVALTRLFQTSTGAAAENLQSAQALFLAESGVERAVVGFNSGTACTSLVYTNVALGAGRFSTTATAHVATTQLSANITATATTIPLASMTNIAPHGRITIGAESIDYSATAGSSLTNARRGAGGTTAAAANANTAVNQNLCLVHSTGTVAATRRVLESALVQSAGSNIALRSNATTAPGVVNVGSGSRATIGSVNANFGVAGTRVVIAQVSLEKTGNPIRSITSGNLRLRRGGANLATNQMPLRIGGNAAPSAQSFTRETYWIMARSQNDAANITYSIDARADGGNDTRGEARMVVIHGLPSSAFRDGGIVRNIGTAGNNLLSNTYAIPSGNTIVLAAVQLANDDSSSRTIPANSLTLRKGNQSGPILASNPYPITLAPVSDTNSTAAILLVGQDATAAASQQYTVRAAVANFGGGGGGGGGGNPNCGGGGGGGSRVCGEAKVLALPVQGFAATYLPAATPTAVNGDTLIGTPMAAYPSGAERVVIASTQAQNNSGGTVAFAPVSGLQLRINGTTQSSSPFALGLCALGVPSLCAHYSDGLLWHSATAPNGNHEVWMNGAPAGAEAVTSLLALGGFGGAVTVVDRIEPIQ